MLLDGKYASIIAITRNGGSSHVGVVDYDIFAFLEVFEIADAKAVILRQGDLVGHFSFTVAPVITRPAAPGKADAGRDGQARP